MDEATLRIERLVAGGDGLAREEDGRVVFVTDAAPDDLVRVRFTARKRDFAKAELIEVLEPGPSRVDPPCPAVARGCGGCGWQHVDPEAALAHKVELVIETARRIGHLDVDVVVGRSLPTDAFRTNLRVAAVGERLGFRRRQSHEVVDVGHCMVAHPLLDEVMASATLVGADETTLRCSPSSGDRQAVVHGDAASTIRSAPADLRVVTDADLDDGERAVLVHEVAGSRFEVGARSFFQTSHAGAEVLVATVRAAVADAPQGRFIDLYGGVGLFAATCADGREIVLVESSASSAQDAAHNLEGRAAIVVEAQVEHWVAPASAVVVADPPRAGLRPKGVERVVASEADRVVLISCDAAAFARDVSGLVEAGYEIVACELLDLFPYTHHVEIVTTLTRGQAARSSLSSGQ